MRVPIPVAQKLATIESIRAKSRRRPSGATRPWGVDKRYFWPILAVLSILILCVGIGIGVVITKRRSRAAETVVAINGVRIDKTSFYNQLEAVAGDATLHRMVGDELQLQFARANGLLPTQAELEAKYAEASRQPDFEKRLDQNHQSPAMYRHSLLVQMAKAAMVTEGVQVTEEEARQYYAKESDPKNLSARYYHPATIQIAVIITPQEAAIRQAQQALSSGVPFADVAQQYSQDRSKAQGGAMPPFQRGRTGATRIPGLDDAIFNLAIGQELGPRRYAGAWWIIHCVNKTEAQTVPYAQVQAECRAAAAAVRGIEMNGKQLIAEFKDFQRRAVIQAFWRRYDNAVSVN